MGALGLSVTATGCAANPPDFCAAAPCKNGGTCTASSGDYTCACASGWTGDTCETLVDPCSPNRCQNGGTCAASGSSYTCACAGGYTGTNCETPPVGPTLGCHDSPGTSGNTGVDDLNYLGPIDTVNNVKFYRAPRDGTCTGSSYQNGAVLIKAASAGAADTKCQSFGLMSVDASLWDGLAGYWLCS